MKMEYMEGRPSLDHISVDERRQVITPAETKDSMKEAEKINEKNSNRNRSVLSFQIAYN